MSGRPCRDVEKRHDSLRWAGDWWRTGRVDTMNILRLRIRPDAPINLSAPLTPTSPSVVTVRNSVMAPLPQRPAVQQDEALPRNQARSSVDGAAASAA